uniref:Protein photinus pyralis n=1 Tax=Xenopsylla cheopis TaxID=163159 RepID=A0A6M2DIM8_XENCH
MGEQAINPRENENSDNIDNPENEELAEGTISAEEMNALDCKLDELDSALDFIEEKNDSIYNQLLTLLQSNKEIRKQLAEQNSSGDQVQN